MNKLKNIIVSLALLMSFGAMFVPTTNVGALDLFPSCSGSNSSKLCGAEGDTAGDSIKTLINTLLFILGVISVVMIIYAGMVYTTSAGDSSKITKAKNILLYSVVGMVVAIASFAIANFVVKAL